MKLDKMNHKINSYHKLEATTPKLDEILKQQKIPKINFGLGFSKGESSKTTKISYAEAAKAKGKIDQARETTKDELDSKRKENHENYKKNGDHSVHQRRRNYITSL